MSETTKELTDIHVHYQNNGEGKVTFTHTEYVVLDDGRKIVTGNTERAAIRLEDLRAQTLDLPVGQGGQRMQRPGTFVDALFAEIAEAQRRDAAARAAANAAAERRHREAQAELDARAKQLEADRAQAEQDAEAERAAIEAQFRGKAGPG